MAVEKHRVVLETLVENPHNRPVSWYKDGQPITDSRYITKGGLVLDMVDRFASCIYYALRFQASYANGFLI